LSRAQSKKLKDEQRFKQYYEEESREFRNARFFCFCNSKFDPEKQESIFVGKPEDLKVFVDATVPDAYAADIPDCPEGLVLTNNHGEGAFDN
jgi:hypothetical protein